MLVFFKIVLMAYQPSQLGLKMYWLPLCRGIRPSSNKSPGYDTKQSDSEAPVMLELWRMWITLSLSLLPGLLWHRVLVSVRVSPVDWGCRIHWLPLCRGIRLPPLHKCPGYDTKQSDSEASVMLEVWRMWSTPSLPLLPGPLWPGVVAPDRVLSKGKIELFDI